VYKMSTNMGTFTTSDMSTNIYCDMTTTDGGWIVAQKNRRNSQLNFLTRTGEDMKMDLETSIMISGLD